MDKLKQVLKGLKNNPVYDRYEFLILPVFSTVVCLALLILIVIPNIITLLETNKQIQDLNSKNQALTTKLKSLEQADPETIKKNIETTLIALPEDKDIPGAINQLLFLVNTNNLKLSGISFSVGSGTEALSNNYQIKMDVSGGLTNLQNFVNKLKESTRTLKPDSIEINGVKFTDVQSTIAVKIYFQPLQKSIGDVEKPLPVITQKDLEPLEKIKNSEVMNSQISGGIINAQKGKTDPFQ